MVELTATEKLILRAALERAIVSTQAECAALHPAEPANRRALSKYRRLLRGYRRLLSRLFSETKDTAGG